MNLLGIYLNDHLAGATAGVELARRVAGTHKGKTSGETFRHLAAEIAEDRDALLRIMRALGVPVQQYKVYAGWIAEKIGRFKPNGHLTTRSPLSDLVELEAMRLGIEGKASGWRSLRAVADHDDRLSGEELDELLARAHRQAQTVEELRTEIAGAVFGG
ncbi:hypothetical protein [Actinoallomurus rhizosphaericola]|uniref:hypothetical protein n=1 Tax=Actinoallomurus rhizosphaericola TaxID=2952536 RepID=UPI002092993E|nr:hypothetical protein [Actinoallomurus rhizosphaericola]MCO5997362.1 hypothetical protein [Actinoallomurus rhizosphaericola]